MGQLIPNKEHPEVVGFQSMKVKDLLDDIKVLPLIKDLTSTGVYLLKRPNYKDVFFCPKKYATKTQQKLWDTAIEVMEAEKSRQEEERKQKFLEDQQKRLNDFLEENSSIMDDCSDEDVPLSPTGSIEIKKPSKPSKSSTESSKETPTKPASRSGPITPSIIIDDDCSLTKDDFLTMIQALQRKIQQLEATMMPVAVHAARTFADVYDTVPQSVFTIDLSTEFSAVLYKDQFYLSLYQGGAGDNVFWKVFSVNRKSGKKGGRTNPTIAFSCYERMDELGVPLSYQLTSKTHSIFVSFLKWFTSYHSLYCVDVYKTCSEEDMLTKPEFIEFATRVFCSRRSNKKRSAKASVVRDMHKMLKGAKGYVGAGKKGATSADLSDVEEGSEESEEESADE